MIDPEDAPNPTAEPTTTPEPEEDLSIKPREIFLFVLFGVVPFVLIYLFAFQGRGDAAGSTFTQERRVVMAQCLKTLKRKKCRTFVDERIMDCYKAHAPGGIRSTAPLTTAQRQQLTVCISKDPEGVFRPNNMPKPEEKKKKDTPSFRERLQKRQSEIDAQRAKEAKDAAKP